MINIKQSLLAFICLLISLTSLQAQSEITGTIYDENTSEKLFGAIIYIPEIQKGAITDSNGKYKLDIPEGHYAVDISYLGYNTVSETIDIDRKNKTQDFYLTPSTESLDAVVVTAKGKIQQTREQPFQVSVLDAKPLQVQSQPVTGLVNQISGVRVREEGGMGSNANIMLNGIGGKGIRIFVDGVPADLFGSGMAINNLPINMIDHIEVYKGVIPAQFGSDALGGMLNLVTHDQKRNYIDVSAGAGSFGTCQASLNSRKYWGEGKKYYTGLSGFYNHSDNNYWMDDVDILEDKLGNVRKGSVRRFNDAYTSYMGRYTTGGRNLHWADDMQLNLSVSRTYKEWQHGITAEKAWGEVFSENKDYNIELRWKKRRMLNEKLNASLVSGYNYSDRYSEDIAKKTYYWGTDNNLPDYIQKNIGAETMLWGEGRTPRIYTHNVFARINASYLLLPKHTLNLTSLTTNEGFSGHDERGTLTFGTDPLGNSQELLKNYIGISLESELFNKRLTNILSAKHFYGKFNVVIIDDDLTNKGYNNESFDDFGYGNALKYQIIPKLSATLNYEYTMRMPDREELFGDFINTFPNSNLTPERSHNIDIGLRFNMAKKLTAEVNMFYRQTSGMIFLNVLNIYKTIYMNLLSADIKGGEGEIRYNPSQTVRLYANATWQDIRLRGTDDNSKIDPRYIGSRLPNEPRIFGNAGASYTLPFNLFKHDMIQVYYTFNYVHEFYLTWEEEGLEATKDRTPTQAVHNGGISYSLDEDKWSLSFESRNFTNEKVYDNFSVQKPGRSFHLKLRMFLE